MTKWTPAAAAANDPYMQKAFRRAAAPWVAGAVLAGLLVLGCLGASAWFWAWGWLIPAAIWALVMVLCIRRQRRAQRARYSDIVSARYPD